MRPHRMYYVSSVCLCLCLLPGLVCCATSTAAASLLGLQRARTVGPLSSPALSRAGRSSRPHTATRGTRRAALRTAPLRHPLPVHKERRTAPATTSTASSLARRAPSRAARRGATRPASERRGASLCGGRLVDWRVHTHSARPKRGPRAASTPPHPPPRACSSTRRTPRRSRRCCTGETRGRGRRVSAGRWSSQEPITAPK